MSSNVGLSTPRGSGTSGYVQRNLSQLKPRSTGAGAPYTLPSSSLSNTGPKARKPDATILRHDRLREIEVRVLELRDELEDGGEEDEDVIDEKCENLRRKLVKELDEQQSRQTSNGRRDVRGGKGLKGYQVHELAEAKKVESERLKKALGLRGSNGRSYGDGGNGSGNGGDEVDEDEHPMARQERRKREKELERVRMEVERHERETESE